MMDDQPRVFQFDDVRVEAHAFKVFKSGHLAELEPKAFKVLLFLLEHRGRLVEKSELLDAVWPDTHVTENAMTREIAKLRKLLGDSSREPKYIETVHTRGYRFIAEVEELNGHTPNGHGAQAAQSTSDTTETELPAHENGANSADGAYVVGESALPVGAVPPALDTAALPARTPLYRRRRHKVLWSAAALGVLLLLGGFMAWRWPARPKSPVQGALWNLVRVTTWPGLDVNPTLAPDGNAVAYSSDHNGSFEIYVRQRVPGGREVQLTADGAQNFDPAWSPDGQLIAYHSLKRGGIWLVPALGGIARQLTDFGAHPAWSRDGAWLAFQAEPAPDIGALPETTSTIWLIPAQGGTPRQLTQAGNPVGSHLAPTWSPDGRRIAFLNANSRATQIWSIAGNGNDLKEMTLVGTGDKADPLYSADGRSLYFTRFGVVWQRQVARDGGLTNDPPVKVADMGDTLMRHLTLSADGKKLAYSAWTQASNLWSLTLATDALTPTGTPMRLTNETGTRNMQPAFNPDGSRLAFVERHRGGGQDIWTVDHDGRNVAPLTTVLGWRNFPRWVQTGDKIVLEANTNGKRTLVALTPATGKEETLAELNGTIEFPQFAPDQRRIACNIRDGGAVNVATMDIASGQLKQLTFDHELMGYTCWSPAGRLLAFQMKRGSDTHVMVMPADGGTPTQLTFAHGQSWPYGWSPDDERVVFAAERDGIWNLWWVARTNGAQQQLTRNTKLNAYFRYPAWSPLGNQIAYEYSEMTGNIYMLDLP